MISCYIVPYFVVRMLLQHALRHLLCIIVKDHCLSCLTKFKIYVGMYKKLPCHHAPRMFFFCKRTVDSFFLSCLQVNFCQKLLFLDQLTQNMTTIVHWITSSIHENSELRTWGEHVVYRNCFWHSEQHVLPMFCKNKSFWQRFTCTDGCGPSSIW